MSKRKGVSRRVRVGTRNRITLPRVVMEAARLRPGDVMSWDSTKSGTLSVTRVRDRTTEHA